jgi:hypothetical protein
MRVITLIPLGKRAKQIVKQHGDRWEVVRKEMCVLFSDSPGPWLYVQPLSEDRAPADTVRAARIDSAARWVHEFNDKDFKVAP